MKSYIKRYSKEINLLPGLRRNELRILAVGETVRERSGEFLAKGDVGVWAPGNGANVRRVNREKIPRLGSHWK